VTIRTTGGRSSTSTVLAPKGAGCLGIAWTDVDAKYRALMPLAGTAAAAIEASLALIHDCRALARASAVVEALRA
jgi:hypothetical protein